MKKIEYKWTGDGRSADEARFRQEVEKLQGCEAEGRGGSVVAGTNILVDGGHMCVPASPVA